MLCFSCIFKFWSGIYSFLQEPYKANLPLFDIYKYFHFFFNQEITSPFSDIGSTNMAYQKILPFKFPPPQDGKEHPRKKEFLILNLFGGCVIQDPMRGGKDDMFEDLVAIIHEGDSEALAKDAVAPPRKRLVPEFMLKLAHRVSPF